MKDVLDQLVSLGIGLAVVSKEQIEKVVDELVEKGKVTKNESSEIIDELVRKGKETQNQWESVVNERVEQALRSMNLVTKKELDELAQRVTALEAQLKQNQEPETTEEIQQEDTSEENN